MIELTWPEIERVLRGLVWLAWVAGAALLGFQLASEDDSPFADWEMGRRLVGSIALGPYWPLLLLATLLHRLWERKRGS